VGVADGVGVGVGRASSLGEDVGDATVGDSAIGRRSARPPATAGMTTKVTVRIVIAEIAAMTIARAFEVRIHARIEASLVSRSRA
jgi:hypothetical protein